MYKLAGFLFHTGSNQRRCNVSYVLDKKSDSLLQITLYSVVGVSTAYCRLLEMFLQGT
jgi:hypothetical protein